MNELCVEVQPLRELFSIALKLQAGCGVGRIYLFKKTDRQLAIIRVFSGDGLVYRIIKTSKHPSELYYSLLDAGGDYMPTFSKLVEKGLVDPEDCDWLILQESFDNVKRKAEDTLSLLRSIEEQVG